jgi:parallel beta-helix repeat protein
MRQVNKVAFGENLLEGLKVGDREAIDLVKSGEFSTGDYDITINSQADWDKYSIQRHWDIDWDKYDWSLNDWSGGFTCGSTWENPPMREFQTFGFPHGARVLVNCDILVDAENTYQGHGVVLNFNGFAISTVQSWNQVQWHHQVFSGFEKIIDLKIGSVHRWLINGCREASCIIDHSTLIHVASATSFMDSAIFTSCSKLTIVGSNNMSDINIPSGNYLFSSCDVEWNGNQVMIVNGGIMKFGVGRLNLYVCVRVHRTIAFDNVRMLTIKEFSVWDQSATSPYCFRLCRQIEIGLGCSTYRTPIFDNCTQIRLNYVPLYNTGAISNVFNNSDNIIVGEIDCGNKPSSNIFNNCRNVISIGQVRRVATTTNIWAGVNTRINTESCQPNLDGSYGAAGSSTPPQSVKAVALVVGFTDDCDIKIVSADDTGGHHTKINAAINSIHSGKIVFREGEYIIRGQINLNKPNIILEGVSQSTTVFKGIGTVSTLIRVTANNTQIKNIGFDYAGFTGTGSAHAIISVGVQDSLIEGCLFENLPGAIFQWQQENKNVVLRNNTIMCPTTIGSLFAFSCENSIIEKCSFIGGQNIIQASGKNNLFADNYFENAATSSTHSSIGVIGGEGNIIKGNRFVSKTSNGRAVSLSSSSDNTILDNHITDCNTGISITSSDRNLVSNNFVKRGAGLAADYSATQQTITVADGSCFGNMIIGNIVLGKAVTSNSSTGTAHTNNYVRDNYTGVGAAPGA